MLRPTSLWLFISCCFFLSSRAFWLEELGDKGIMPLAPDGEDYKFFRNVKDFGAKGDGETDDTEAINRAASEGSRCGLGCAGTSTTGALVYFPPGTYLVKEPLVQYYYTQFVGDPHDRPILKAHEDFKGVAVIDTDPYIPGANGAQWYINQNQFFRQVRNFIINIEDMPEFHYDDNGQGHAPVAIHWQVAQATSLQNIQIEMRGDGEGSAKTAIGVFTENGSGGFVSDLEISGGFIGYQVGSQQGTFRNLRFSNVQSAVQVTWTWGMTWQQIAVENCVIGFNVTGKMISGSADGQGVGSLAIIDSQFKDTTYGVAIHDLNDSGPPELVLDNLRVENVSITVGVNERRGITYLAGPDSEEEETIKSWALGTRYASRDGSHEVTYGLVHPAPVKPSKLVDDNGNYFVRSKPNYRDIEPDDWIVVTDNGVKNDGTGDQTEAINKILASDGDSESDVRYIYFPAGIYLVESTIEVPPGIVIVGSGWSDIRATGLFFGDMIDPQPVVRAGKPGDKGIIEISDMMFTIKGEAPGAIMMEWNIKQSNQGSAAMWDSHFRIGGAAGTDLTIADCPASGGLQSQCIAASMLLHVTTDGSGYFENIWAWTADHDIDAPVGDATTTTSTMISIFSARGVLIESKGPTWMYGTASEHNVLYQYQLSGAENVYMGHFQTETPYFQPAPVALEPFSSVGVFPDDPTFDGCVDDTCIEAWGLRIVESRNVFVYSAGLYSFFNDYDQACLDSEDCQERLLRIESSKQVWMFNIFTKGVTEVVSGFGEIPAVPFNFTANSGFTSEVGAYLPFAGNGSVTKTHVIYIDPEIWSEPEPSLDCPPPCVIVLPPSTLETETTFTFPPLTTTLEIGWTTTEDDTTKFTTSTITTTITIPAVTTSVIEFWNYNVTSESKSDSNDSLIIIPITSVQPPPFTVIQTYPSGVEVTNSTRTIFPPPWPYSTVISDSTDTTPDPTETKTYLTTRHEGTITPVTTFVEKPTTTRINGKDQPVIPCHAWFVFSCPPDTSGWALEGWTPGIHPPGPPPPIRTPTDPTPVIETLPPIPWPEITIGPDLVPTYPPKIDELECETAEEEFCRIIVSRSIVDPDLKKRQDNPTTTTTNTNCITARGCAIQGTDITTTTTPEATPEPHPYVVYPKSPTQVVAIELKLSSMSLSFYKSDSPSLGTIFLFVHSMTSTQLEELNTQFDTLGIQDIVIPHGKLTAPGRPFLNPAAEPSIETEDETIVSNDDASAANNLKARAPKSERVGVNLGKAGVSWGPDSLNPLEDPTYYYDSSEGEGTFVYIIDWGAYTSHVEFSKMDPKPSPILTEPYPPEGDFANIDSIPAGNKPGYHGTNMMAHVAGSTLGIARKAFVAYTVMNQDKSVYEHFLDGLLKAHDIIREKGHGSKAVVNMSIYFQLYRQVFEIEGIRPTSSVSEAFLDKMAYIIRSLIDMGVVVVCGSGNRGNAPIDGYPAHFKDPADRNHIPDLIVVGSTMYYGAESPFKSQRADYIDVWAPGEFVTSTHPFLGPNGYRNGFGTSIASAVTSGLAAYLRGLNPELTTARQVAGLIKSLAFKRHFINSHGKEENGNFVNMIWNGQTKDGTSPCIKPPSLSRRQEGDTADADVCILPGRGSSGKPLTLSPGAPSPTCTGDNCGKYCTGFFCSAPCSTKCGPPPDTPTQTRNPDFLDPNNPDSCQNEENLNFGNCNGPPLIAPPCKTTTISGTLECYTSPTSTPSPTTTSKPPPPPPEPTEEPRTFLKVEPVVCHNEDDFPGHADIQKKDQRSNAATTCGRALSRLFEDMGDPDAWDSDADLRFPPGSRHGYFGTDNFGIDYIYDIHWKKGCKTFVDEQSVRDPVEIGISCTDILTDTYTQCNNGGVGGYIDAGCLRYTFWGGKKWDQIDFGET